jgi:2-octaprenyl-6-methoxyphenol hydroxylase
MIDFDVIIVGGGLVGAGLAAALREVPLRIALVDARLPDNNDPRLFALNAGSCHFLKNLGLWSELESVAQPIHQVHVSQRGRFGAVRLSKQDVGLPELGHVIPARHIEQSLNNLLNDLPNVTFYRPAKLVKIDEDSRLRGNDSVTLTLETADGIVTLRTRFVIGADGTDSLVRQQAGIAAEEVDYDQNAIVTRTHLQRSHRHIAYERFVENGAIAMLPLNDLECATIWSTSSAQAKTLMSLSDADFLQQLQQMFGYRLGRLQNISARHCFPLRMMRAKQMYAGRIFLLGNAAHTVHPVAAQGFNLALYEVALLAEDLINTVKTAADLTCEKLQKLSELAARQQKVSIGFSHRLTQYFSIQSAWMSILTSLGMTGMDAAQPLKKYLLQRILGRTGSVPRLLLDVNG